MTRHDRAVLGWDIGGVNTKAVRLAPGDQEPALRSHIAAYEIQRDPDALVSVLRRAAAALGGSSVPHAVTMTAELSQHFRTKREGVGRVLDAVEAAFPGEDILVYTVGGEFLPPDEARHRPWDVGASNWAATARLVGQAESDCLLMDIGTTSTDIIPIEQGEPAAEGRTDPERLASGELVYTGALRTPAEAVVWEVPYRGRPCRVSAEGFALIGDAHLWLGRLSAQDYTVAAPDGRPATREYAGERLARVICGDREMLDDEAIDAIARALAEAQVRSVRAALERVRSRHPRLGRAVVTGVGDFIAAEAARSAGLAVAHLETRLGSAARAAPAAAVAWLLTQRLADRQT